MQECEDGRILSVVTGSCLNALTFGGLHRKQCMNCGECGSLCVCVSDKGQASPPATCDACTHMKPAWHPQS